jgi:protocatechuate 3,4-dioxygenase beta subunit
MGARFLTSLASALIVATASSADAQRPSRDAVKPAETGTGSIAGVVVTDDRDARPLRRARVFVSSSDRVTTRTVVTDDAGRFTAGTLPPGRYTVTASKQGYVSFIYGARRPGRPGTSIVVAEGERVANLTLKMPRGSVITGVIVDHNGEPMSNVTVYAMRYAFNPNGQRQLVPFGAGTPTDDRGHYRIWGLAAGDYAVSATAGFQSQMMAGVDITRVTDADVKRGMAQAASGSPRPSAAAAAVDTPDRSRSGRSVGYANVYYPGTFAQSQATMIKLGVAEERSGVDFALALVPTARVQGTISVPEGVNPHQLVIQLVGNNPAGMLLDIFRRTTAAADGSFSFSGIAPGMYTLIVRGMPTPTRAAPLPPGGGRGGPGAQMTHYAMAEISVEGQDISGVALTLQAGMTLTGRIVTEGATPPPDLSRVRVTLSSVQGQGEVSIGGASTQADASGRFTMSGVTPGRYRLTGAIPSARPDTQAWHLKSALINGRDTADLPIDLQSSTDDVVVTLTDRPSELSGMVQDSSGQAALDYQVIVFPADRSLWPSTRRVRSIKPSADGKYAASNLPPGDYLISAVLDVEPGEWFDPAFLEPLSRGAFKVAIGEGEKKVQDLRVAPQIP